MPRILQVIQNLEVGGAEQVLMDLIGALGPLGFQCDVVLFEDRGILREEARRLGASVFVSPKPKGLAWRTPLSLARIVRHRSIDLLHAHNPGPGLYAGIAGLLTGRPVVVTRHGMSHDRNKARMRRIVSSLCTATVCVSRQILEKAREGDGIPAKKLHLIYNGVSIDHMTSASTQRDIVRRELGLPHTAPVVLSVGRLSMEKNYGLLIRAMAGLEIPGEPPHLVVVGDGPERAALEHVAAETGCGDKVHFLGIRRDIPRLASACDLFALSSDTEGISKSILEAAAAGLPVVATNVGGTGEIVRDSHNGLLVPPNDETALRASIKRLITQPDLARSLATAGTEDIRQKFSLPACAQGYTELFQSII